MNLKEIIIKTEYINLGQFLKFSNIITNGGEAKIFIEYNDIFVNDELDKRRGRKLYTNDIIRIDDDIYIIKCI